MRRQRRTDPEVLVTDGAASLSHLLARAELVEDRVRELVQRGGPTTRRPTTRSAVSTSTTRWSTGCWNRIPPADPDAADWTPPARAAVEAQADVDEAAGEVLRLRRLARDAGLTPLDVELLLVSLLPDLDTRFERLYGYLNDDVTRRRASVALALELAGASPMVGGGAGPAGAEPAAGAARSAGRRGPGPPAADPGAAGARPGVGPPAG